MYKMDKWEYHFEDPRPVNRKQPTRHGTINTVADYVDGFGTMKRMKELGKEGWELVGVWQDVLLFKRRKVLRP